MNPLLTFLCRDLGINLIQDLPKSTFESNHKLAILNLDQNKLTKLVLQHYPIELTHLYASQNQLQMVSLANLTKLSSLHLSANNITKLEFESLNQLEKLNLNSNQLSELPNMNDLVSLKELDVDNNLLTEIDFSIFPTFIKTLKLSRNLIHKLAFPSQMQSLIEIDLKGNNLATLPANFFHSLPFVTTLNLADNMLRNIDVKMIPSSILSLDLSTNLLETLEFGPNNISDLNFQLNNLFCDCNLVEGLKTVTGKYQPFTCSLPQNIDHLSSLNC